MNKYEKKFLALKYFLLGRNYYVALRALEFARQYHRGTRKDQVTPELAHQIEICLYIMTLRDVKDEETTLAVALLHDIREDYEISAEEITLKFGKKIADAVWLLTKKFKGNKKDLPSYFEAISKDPIASIVKGADRIHNLNSMVGVFTKEKQIQYVAEVEQYFLPMIKQAKYLYPEQSPAYFNILDMLKNSIHLLKAMNGEKKG